MGNTFKPRNSEAWGHHLIDDSYHYYFSPSRIMMYLMLTETGKNTLWSKVPTLNTIDPQTPSSGWLAKWAI